MTDALTKVPPGTRTPLFLTAEASMWMDQWYRENHETGHLNYFDPTLRSLERRQIMGLKLAMILAISDGTIPEVELRHLKNAMEILGFEDQYLDQFLDRVRERDDAQYYDWIKTYLHSKGGWATLGSITQRFKKTIGRSGLVMSYIQTMLLAGELERSKAGKVVWFGLPGVKAPWE